VAQVAETQSIEVSDFARAVAFGIGELDLAELGPDADGPVVGLGAWMRANSVGRNEVSAAMWSLRQALLEVAGLDKATEPVPMRTPDRARSVWIMAAYLEDLVARAAALCSRRDGVEGAVSRKWLLARAVELLEG
jgi:hypothetical protein